MFLNWLADAENSCTVLKIEHIIHVGILLNHLSLRKVINNCFPIGE